MSEIKQRKPKQQDLSNNNKNGPSSSNNVKSTSNVGTPALSPEQTKASGIYCFSHLVLVVFVFLFGCFN